MKLLQSIKNAWYNTNDFFSRLNKKTSFSDSSQSPNAYAKAVNNWAEEQDRENSKTSKPEQKNAWASFKNFFANIFKKKPKLTDNQFCETADQRLARLREESVKDYIIYNGYQFNRAGDKLNADELELTRLTVPQTHVVVFDHEIAKPKPAVLIKTSDTVDLTIEKSNAALTKLENTIASFFKECEVKLKPKLERRHSFHI